MPELITTAADPDRNRGLYRKFTVTRTNPEAGERHPDCEYFVLDVTHDKHAPVALAAYAASCRVEFPALAADLDAKAQSCPECGDHRGWRVEPNPADGEPMQVQCRTCAERPDAEPARTPTEDQVRILSIHMHDTIGCSLTDICKCTDPANWFLLEAREILRRYNLPQRCAPSDEDLRRTITRLNDGENWWKVDHATSEIAALYAAQPTVEEAKAQGALEVIDAVKGYMIEPGVNDGCPLDLWLDDLAHSYRSEDPHA